MAMTPCPHCQFLVPAGAETCGVCRQPVAMPEQPAGPWGADPGPGFSGVSGPTPAGSGVARFVAPQPGSGSTAAKVVVALVAGVALLGLVCVAAVTLIGHKVDRSASAAVPADWQVFRDPAGRFQVELPGVPVTRQQTTPAGAGEAVHVDTIDVARGAWESTVVVVDVPDGSQIDVPLAAMQQDLTQAISSNPRASGFTITSSVPAAGAAGPALDVGFDVDVAGVHCSGRAHYEKHGPDPYGVISVGPSTQPDGVRATFERAVASLRVPATP